MIPGEKTVLFRPLVLVKNAPPRPADLYCDPSYMASFFPGQAWLAIMLLESAVFFIEFLVNSSGFFRVLYWIIFISCLGFFLQTFPHTMLMRQCKKCHFRITTFFF